LEWEEVLRRPNPQSTIPTHNPPTSSTRPLHSSSFHFTVATCRLFFGCPASPVPQCDFCPSILVCGEVRVPNPYYLLGTGLVQPCGPLFAFFSVLASLRITPSGSLFKQLGRTTRRLLAVGRLRETSSTARLLQTRNHQIQGRPFECYHLGLLTIALCMQ